MSNTRACSFVGCDRAHSAKGLCAGHYQQQWRGVPLTQIWSGSDLATRLSKYTEKSDGCWMWTGARSHGYGVIGIAGRTHNAHRVAFEMRNGPVSSALEVDHICRVRGCVRPDHLRAVTTAENQQNRSKQRNNTSGERGVIWLKRDRVYEARVTVAGVTHSGGRFRDFDDAVAAVRALRAQLHPFSKEGSAARAIF